MARIEVVHDTFTGPAGPLTGHVGEIGATWSFVGAASPSVTVSPVLDGGGYLIDTPGGSGVLWPSGAQLLDDDVTIEMYFTVSGGATSGIGFCIGGGVGSERYFLQLDGTPPWMMFNLYYTSPSGSWTLLNSAYVDPLGPGPHKIQIDMRGASKAVFLNGTSLLSVTDSRILRGGVSLNVGGAMLIDRFLVTTPGSTTPPVFWFDFHRSHEQP